MTPFSVYSNEDSCSAPGYTDDPLLGCYRFVTATVTKPEAIQGCANDGGRLLLINSEAEALALGALIRMFFFKFLIFYC